MAALNDDQRVAAVNIGFELAKFGIEHFMGRKLAREEEEDLLSHLREKEAQREFKTPSELVGPVEGVEWGTTGHEE